MHAFDGCKGAHRHNLQICEINQVQTVLTFFYILRSHPTAAPPPLHPPPRPRSHLTRPYDFSPNIQQKEKLAYQKANIQSALNNYDLRQIV